MIQKFVLLLLSIFHLSNSINTCEEIGPSLNRTLNLLQDEVNKAWSVKLKFEQESELWFGEKLKQEANLKKEKRRGTHKLAKTMRDLETTIESEKMTLKLNDDYNEALKMKMKAEDEVSQLLKIINSGLKNEIDQLNNDLKEQKANDVIIMKSPTWQRILILAARKGDVDEVNSLLNKGISANIRDDTLQQNTPLIAAAKNGHHEVVQLLLDKGASLEETSLSLNTALHEAASAGHLQVCNILLDRNAKLEPYNNNNETPLQLAEKNGHKNVIDLLVQRKTKT